MKTPKLEEVKEYFKDAKEIKCLGDDKVYDLEKYPFLVKGIDIEDGSFCFSKYKSLHRNINSYVIAWSYTKEKYAEIITYKNKIMKSDLSKVKVGDSIWTIQEGWTKVSDNKDSKYYPIRTENETYTLDGRLSTDDQHPSAFLTNPFEGYKVDEAFIKEAYQSACSDWKAKLKDKFPEVFKSELEVGKWYKWTDNYYKTDVMFITKVEGNRVYYYGIFNKNWTDEDWGDSQHKYVLATEAEVKEALINEAEKRGFKEGVTIIPIRCDKKQKLETSNISYNHKLSCLNILDINGNLQYKNYNHACIYSDGTWAKIIKETKVSLTDLIECYKKTNNIDNLKVI